PPCATFFPYTTLFRSQLIVQALGASSIDIAVRAWANTSHFWPVRFEILKAIKLRLNAEGIEIPFPQQVVYMHQVEAAREAAAAEDRKSTRLNSGHVKS